VVGGIAARVRIPRAETCRTRQYAAHWRKHVKILAFFQKKISLTKLLPRHRRAQHVIDIGPAQAGVGSVVGGPAQHARHILVVGVLLQDFDHGVPLGQLRLEILHPRLQIGDFLLCGVHLVHVPDLLVARLGDDLLRFLAGLLEGGDFRVPAPHKNHHRRRRTRTRLTWGCWRRRSPPA
jgi:hypothetical protein